MRTFLRRIFAFLLLLLALALVGSACTITIGPYDEAEGTGSQKPSALPSLPEPDNAQGEPWNLTPEQQARREEADRYVIEKVYKGSRTISTTIRSMVSWPPCNGSMQGSSRTRRPGASLGT
jgi:hypothetical protein